VSYDIWVLTPGPLRRRWGIVKICFLFYFCVFKIRVHNQFIKWVIACYCIGLGGLAQVSVGNNETFIIIKISHVLKLQFFIWNKTNNVIFFVISCCQLIRNIYYMLPVYCLFIFFYTYLRMSPWLFQTSRSWLWSKLFTTDNSVHVFTQSAEFCNTFYRATI
jgi:hypothetical protein